MNEMFNIIIKIVAVLLLIVYAINIYTCYRDVKEIKQILKEKLKLEIEILKLKNK